MRQIHVRRTPLVVAAVLAAVGLAVAVMVVRASTVLDSDTFDSLSTSRWTVTDSQQLLTANGRLVGRGKTTPTWNDPGLVGKTSYPRIAGRAVVANVLHRDVVNNGPVVGWTTLGLPADPRTAVHALYSQQRTLRAARGPAGPVPLGSDFNGANFLNALTNTEYIYTVVLRPSGAFYFVSTLPNGTHAAWPQASLVWVDNTQTGGPVVPFISNFNQEFTVDDLRVVDLEGAFASAYGIATGADTFDRADGPLTSGNPDVGGPWSADNGTWMIAGGRLAMTGGASGLARATLPASADGIFEVTVHTPAAAPFSAGVLFRGSDSQNFLSFRLRNDRVQLVKTEAGAETVIAQTFFPGASNTDYRLMVRATGPTIQMYVNGQEPINAAQTVAFNATATRAGVVRDVTSDTGSTFEEFAAWPGTVAMPGDAGPGPYGGARGTTVIDRQDWSGIPFPGPEWSQYTKRFAIYAGSVIGLVDFGNELVKALPSSDVEIASDIRLRDTDGLILAGLAYRLKDEFLNNHFTRFFRIPGDPTIEIEVGLSVNGQGSSIIRYVPITDQVGLGQTARLRVAAKGPWITVYLGDRPKITYYSTVFQTEKKFGLYSDSADFTSFWDNWEARTIP
jgi:hypothetical protein